jgi:hypothetical protein
MLRHRLMSALVLLGTMCLTPGSLQAESKTAKYRSVVTFSGGNGSSPETAIIVHAPDQISGFPSVFIYIKGHLSDYPYVIKEQREYRNNKTYEVVTLASYNWKRRQVYFDVTEFAKKK